MTMHPAEFSRVRISALVRTEVQRGRALAESAIAEARDLGFEIVEANDGVDFRYDQGWSDEQKKILGDDLSAALKDMGSSYGELANYKKRKVELLKIIGD